jgi:hypothetical protein
MWRSRSLSYLAVFRQDMLRDCYARRFVYGVYTEFFPHQSMSYLSKPHVCLDYECIYPKRYIISLRSEDIATCFTYASLLASVFDDFCRNVSCRKLWISVLRNNILQKSYTLSYTTQLKDFFWYSIGDVTHITVLEMSHITKKQLWETTNNSEKIQYWRCHT